MAGRGVERHETSGTVSSLYPGRPRAYDRDHMRQQQATPAMPLPSVLASLPAALRHLATERRLGKGEHLFRRGDAPVALYHVSRGEIMLVRQAPSGAEVILQRARQGFIAEASLDQPAYHCDAVAAEPATALAIPKAAFAAALEDGAFRGVWLRHLGTELRRARAQNERLNLRGAADRIIHYLDTEGTGGRLVLTQSRKAWAAELGLTHEALYRSLRKMTRQGLIDVAGDTITLLAER